MRAKSVFVLPERLEGGIHELVEAGHGEIGDFFVVIEERMRLVSVRIAVS